MASWVRCKSSKGLKEPGKWAQQRQSCSGRGLSVLVVSFQSSGKAEKGASLPFHVGIRYQKGPPTWLWRLRELAWQQRELEWVDLICTCAWGPSPNSLEEVGWGTLGSTCILGHPILRTALSPQDTSSV